MISLCSQERRLAEHLMHACHPQGFAVAAAQLVRRGELVLREEALRGRQLGVSIASGARRMNKERCTQVELNHLLAGWNGMRRHTS